MGGRSGPQRPPQALLPDVDQPPTGCAAAAHVTHERHQRGTSPRPGPDARPPPVRPEARYGGRRTGVHRSHPRCPPARDPRRRSRDLCARRGTDRRHRRGVRNGRRARRADEPRPRDRPVHRPGRFHPASSAIGRPNLGERARPTPRRDARRRRCPRWRDHQDDRRRRARPLHRPRAGRALRGAGRRRRPRPRGSRFAPACTPARSNAPTTTSPGSRFTWQHAS